MLSGLRYYCRDKSHIATGYCSTECNAFNHPIKRGRAALPSNQNKLDLETQLMSLSSPLFLACLPIYDAFVLCVLL